MAPLTLEAIEAAADDENRDWGDPFVHEGVTVVEANGGIRHLRDGDHEFAIVHYGMIHTAIAILDPAHPLALALLDAQGITHDDPIELDSEPDSLGDHQPAAVWLKRMPGMFATSTKLRLNWERVRPLSQRDRWDDSVDQSGGDDFFRVMRAAGFDRYEETYRED